MAQLDMVFSREFGFDDAGRSRLHQALAAHVPVGKPQLSFRKSAGSTLPELIELIATVEIWLLFAPAAAAFSATIGKRAADAGWDFVRSRFRQTKAEPIADIATVLAETASSVATDVEVRFTLRLPGEHFGASLAVAGRDPETLARALSAFVVHAESIHLEMQAAAISDGWWPHGDPTVTVADDGGVVLTWKCADGTGFRKHIT